MSSLQAAISTEIKSWEGCLTSYSHPSKEPVYLSSVAPLKMIDFIANRSIVTEVFFNLIKCRKHCCSQRNDNDHYLWNFIFNMGLWKLPISLSPQRNRFWNLLSFFFLFYLMKIKPNIYVTFLTGCSKTLGIYPKWFIKVLFKRKFPLGVFLQFNVF